MLKMMGVENLRQALVVVLVVQEMWLLLTEMPMFRLPMLEQ
jgi:hypothetical protein